MRSPCGSSRRPRAALLRAVLGVACAVTIVVGCGQSTSEITGVVIEVNGSITTVESFVVRLPDGSDQVVTPAPDMTFDGGAAIGHLRDHLRSAGPVTIRYEVLSDGTWVAREVSDAPG